MKQIPLTQGKFSIVDDEDFPLLSQFKWYAHLEHGYFYATRASSRDKVTGKQKVISMSRFIMNAPKGMLVDHKNGDTLDNRRKNLRICTHAENGRNRTKINNKHGFKGLKFHW